MSIFGPPNIEKMKARRDVEGLIKALTYNHSRIKVVKDQKPATGIGMTLDATMNEHRKRRAVLAELAEISEEAAEALGEIGDARAVQPLIAVLPVIPEEAAEALGKIGDSRAVDPLIAMLRNKEADERFAAAKALGNLGDARALEPLLDSLDRNYDSKVRKAIVESLGRMKAARAIDRLIPLLKHKEKELADAVAEALASIGSPAVESLIAALKDQRWNQRWMASAVLDRIGWRPDSEEQKAWYSIARRDWEGCAMLGPSSVDPLGAILGNKSEEENIRTEVMRVLKEIEDPRAVDMLISVFNVDLTDTKYENTPKRKVAIKALEDIGGPRVVMILIGTLEDQELAIRQEAAQALANLYRNNRLDLLSKQKIFAFRNRLLKRHTDIDTNWDHECKVYKGHEDVREGVEIDFGDMETQSSASIGTPSSLEMESIAAILAEGNQAACLVACQSLLSMRNARAAEMIIDAMTYGPNGGLFGTTLGMMGADLVMEPLVAALRDKNEKLRIVASSVVGLFRDVRAIEPLVAALKDENDEVRTNALNGLKKLAQDENEAVRQSADEALGKIP
jgi:HEAT repeat protein